MSTSALTSRTSVTVSPGLPFSNHVSAKPTTAGAMVPSSRSIPSTALADCAGLNLTTTGIQQLHVKRYVSAENLNRDPTRVIPDQDTLWTTLLSHKTRQTRFGPKASKNRWQRASLD